MKFTNAKININLEINYDLLKKQKDILIRMIQDWGEADDENQKEEAKEIEGLLGVIDALQDHAVDELGFTEDAVFNF